MMRARDSDDRAALVACWLGVGFGAAIIISLTLAILATIPLLG